MFDGKAFGQEVVASVKAHLDKQLAPLLARIEALEGRPQPKEISTDDVAAKAADILMPTVKELRDAVDAIPTDFPVLAMVNEALAEVPQAPTQDEIKAMVEEAALASIAETRDLKQELADFRRALESLPQPDIPALVTQEVEKAIASLPPALPGEKGEKGDPGADGKSVLPEEIGEVAWDIIEMQVREAVAALELPRGEKGEAGPQGPAGADGRNGKDGLDAVRFLRAANGELLVTMSDGSVRELGQIDGKDGRDGQDGINGKDGQDGVNGKDADVEPIQAQLAVLYDEHVDIDTVNEMIGAAVAKHTPEPVLDFVPDEIAESVSLAIKTLAGYVGKTVEVEPRQERAEVQPITFHMPPINVAVPKQDPPVINMAAPVVTVEPTVVNVDVEIPKKGKEVTRVTEWDPQGRIKAFEKSEE